MRTSKRMGHPMDDRIAIPVAPAIAGLTFHHKSGSFRPIRRNSTYCKPLDR